MTEEKKPGLYQMINQAIQKQECMLCTVLEGDSQGEKALFCGGEKVWCSKEDGFLASVEEKFSEVSGSGILKIGETRIFCEQFGGKNRLVICGAGHVSIPVIEIGKKIGFHVTVLVDRPMFANHAREAGADEVICDSFEHGMDEIQGGTETYFVIVTRGHRYDTLCLEKVIQKSNAYIGMMGSRRRVALVKDQLAGQGISRPLLEQVHTPIGLSIGAETPEEIAVSIMAEIIQVKNSKKRTAGYAGEILEALMAAQKSQNAKKLPEAEEAQKLTAERPVLAVIVSKKGSVPRGVGTKMLIYRDGRTVGTIGGGCMEGEIIQKARLMMSGAALERQLVKLDMTGKDAEDEGMVCGGVVEVYLERSIG